MRPIFSSWVSDRFFGVLSHAYFGLNDFFLRNICSSLPVTMFLFAFFQLPMIIQICLDHFCAGFFHSKNKRSKSILCRKKILALVRRKWKQITKREPIDAKKKPADRRRRNMFRLNLQSIHPDKSLVLFYQWKMTFRYHSPSGQRGTKKMRRQWRWRH